MTADRDYNSGAFLDWFPGNIQHLNSIASVLQCPPAAQRQYNETAGRAGTQKQDTLLHSPLFSVGKAVIAVAVVSCCCASYVAEGKTKIAKQQVYNQVLILSRSQCCRSGRLQTAHQHSCAVSLKLYPGRCCSLSDFMMKVNN